MALSGTLKDFGIADILQLIGNQQKTGALLLKSGGDEVEVLFIDGGVVFATEKHRRAHNFLGNMLLRADLITQQQLDEALVEQQRSLKRLGDILIEKGVVTEQQLAQITRLQTTETLYKLFRWKSGTYEFEVKEVEPGKSTFDPIRAESILLEGFRRMDEYPGLKKKLPWDNATFERVKELDVRDAPKLDDGGFGLDGDDSDESKPKEKHKIVYRLAEPGRDLHRMADLSRMGEFETLKAATELIDWGYLKAVAPPRGTAAAVKNLAEGGRRLAASGAVVRLLITVAAFALTLFLARTAAPAFGSSTQELRAERGASQRLLARSQMLRLESALQIFRLEHGTYPQGLAELVEGRLVAQQDIQYPYRETYFYKRTEEGYVLLPPLD